MKSLKNKTLAFLFLFSVTGQVFAMGALLPNLGNIGNILSLLTKTSPGNTSPQSIINQVEGSFKTIKK